MYSCPLLDQRYSKLKQSVIKPEDKDRVVESYQRLIKALAVEAERIEKQGPSSIPEVDFSTVEANNGHLPEGLAEQVRHTGCVIIRGVVPEEQATKWESDLRDYTKRHPKIAGFPKHDPQNFSLFWTPSQVQIRSHPQVLKAMHSVSKLWHLSRDDGLFDMSSQVVYADRFRIRHPSLDSEYTLNAHQDSGAIERWEDHDYRGCYQKVFEGRWEDYDPWNADLRSDAKTDLYDSGKSCTAFRSMQGWISLSHTGTGEGTLRLIPELKLCTAYQLLRPYFILGEQFDNETPLFPGATPGSLQFMPTKELHPHMMMEKTMVGIPPVKPGDYVFWHCDLVHEVDKFHPGTRDSSVSYNGCVPLCPYNLENLVKMRQSFKDILPPDDFRLYEHGELEKEHEDHGAKDENILSKEGRRALGLEAFDVDEEGLTEGQRNMRRMANERLGFAV